MADELTKSLLLEDVVVPRNVADALFVSVTSGVPLVQALTDAGAATHVRFNIFPDGGVGRLRLFGVPV